MKSILGLNIKHVVMKRYKSYREMLYMDELSKGVNLKTMDSICHCLFSDFTKNSFLGSAFEYSGTLGEMYEFISNSVK